ncbi:MAG: AbrB/MazE/SpoVT family DNA-binding domain-containing protein [Granulosicoccus sp.]
MPKLSAKRQITLPVDQCRKLGIEPGDDVESYVSGGFITLVKKESGAAKGVLAHIKGKKGTSDEESRQSSMQ